MSDTSGTGPGTVSVYCRSWCMDCRRAKQWLAERDIDFTEIDVEADEDARDFAASLNDGDLHTPTIVCDAGVCVDFRPDRLRELFGVE